jgi:hypothetical protein
VYNHYKVIAGRKLKSSSVCLAQNVDKVSSESSRTEAESLNSGSEIKLDVASVEIISVNDRPVNVYCDSSNDGGIS